MDAHASPTPLLSWKDPVAITPCTPAPALVLATIATSAIDRKLSNAPTNNTSRVSLTHRCKSCVVCYLLPSLPTLFHFPLTASSDYHHSYPPVMITYRGGAQVVVIAACSLFYFLSLSPFALAYDFPFCLAVIYLCPIACGNSKCNSVVYLCIKWDEQDLWDHPPLKKAQLNVFDNRGRLRCQFPADVRLE